MASPPTPSAEISVLTPHYMVLLQSLCVITKPTLNDVTAIFKEFHQFLDPKDPELSFKRPTSSSTASGASKKRAGKSGPVPSRKVVPPDFPDVVEVRRRLEANHTMESSKWRQSKVAKDNGMSYFPGRPRRGSSVGLVARQLRVVRSSHPTASGLSSARRETTGSSGGPAKSLEPTWCPKRCQMTTKSSLWEGKILAMVEPVD
ncbi:hypothetical protein HPB51_019520 [Rhipicephalus microplus]|uniref:Uncharacterized protein n=1 Tax=Rhipicephalus microplus TaxID=6941 RepID=A0A9J6EBE6_RHIMP|nr:hypothetical protein HPB51_019520 [Rhipicephalus microplus]